MARAVPVINFKLFFMILQTSESKRLLNQNQVV